MPPDIARFTRTGDLVQHGRARPDLADTLGDRLAVLMPHHGITTAGRDRSARRSRQRRTSSAPARSRCSPASTRSPSSDEEALQKRERSARHLAMAWAYLSRDGRPQAASSGGVQAPADAPAPRARTTAPAGGHRHHDARRPHPVGAGERPSIRLAIGRIPRNADRPERHDPSPLVLGDAELEPRGRGGVRAQVAESGDRDEDESRAVATGSRRTAPSRRRAGPSETAIRAAGAGHAARDQQRRGDRAGAEAPTTAPAHGSEKPNAWARPATRCSRDRR